MSIKKWFSADYRRMLIDSHIADWDERFQSQLDPHNYVDMLEQAGVSSALIYACCHQGNCYWPTKVGHQHRNLKQRDILGEILELCYDRGIKPTVYYSLIYNNWVYHQHPDWRIIRHDGRPTGEDSRYGTLCPNSPYRDFAAAQLEELCRGYRFEGFFLDMSFWPAVCYCAHCQRRYASEVGGKLPWVINWTDAEWLGFQRKRQEWIVDFVGFINRRIKALKPTLAVNHQFSSALATWARGVPLELADHYDYLEADFYGGPVEQSFACKLFAGLTRNHPFEYMTSRCVHLHDHTTTKPSYQLEAQALLTAAHGGAVMFIDAIDPLGTLDRRVYERIGNVFAQVKPLEPFLGGELCADVGIYYRPEANFNPGDTDKPVGAPGLATEMPHLQSCRGVARCLREAHITFGVVTRKDLAKFSRYQVIVLPQVLMLDEQEAAALRRFASNGGNLYVSGLTSLFGAGEHLSGDFLLADLLGCSYQGQTEEGVTYIAPVADNPTLWDEVTTRYPLTVYGPQVKVQASPSAEVLATIALPYTNPADPSRSASIHSNPPGIWTDLPAVILNRVGKGKVCYVAANLETEATAVHRSVLIGLIRSLASRPFLFEAQAPGGVELILMHQSRARRFILSLVNFPTELPAVPVRDVQVIVRLPGELEGVRIEVLPEKESLPFRFQAGQIELVVPRLETFVMLGIQYEKFDQGTDNPLFR